MKGPSDSRLRRLRQRLSDRLHATLGEGVVRGVAEVSRRHPLARPERHNVEIIRDIPYVAGSPRAAHRLDIYRPTRHRPPWPVVLYIHGGGFATLSKDTHWIMGLAYARFGYLVCNISYRLAPRHPFPAALEDATDALTWVVRNARTYGGDITRLVFAGESAGGNLATALAVATCYERPEPFAQRAFALGVVPRAVIPACAILQVSDAARFGRRKSLPAVVDDVLVQVSDAYLRGVDRAVPGALDLADPLCLFERGAQPDRPLPSFFVPVGTKDPLLDDTRRLERALAGLGVECEARYYEGEVHAFHALVWRRAARRCWRDTLAFLDRQLRERNVPHVKKTGPIEIWDEEPKVVAAERAARAGR
jgi:acetyl esterase